MIEPKKVAEVDIYFYPINDCDELRAPHWVLDITSRDGNYELHSRKSPPTLLRLAFIWASARGLTIGHVSANIYKSPVDVPS